MQLFDKVDGKVTPGKGRKRILDFYLKTSTYPEIKSFKVNGATLLPPEVSHAHSPAWQMPPVPHGFLPACAVTLGHIWCFQATTHQR